MTAPGPVDISVVIPVHNEEGSLTELHERLTQVLSSLEKSYEIIFVDDGSTDASFKILASIGNKDDYVKIIRLRRNFGKSAAVKAGFDYSRGNILVTMDGDLQEDPADIPLFLAKLDEGYDMVNGWRADRKDPFFSKKLPSRLFNRLASWVTGVKVHDFGSPLKAFRREVIENIDLYGEMHRYMPALASWMGASIAELKVRHNPRRHGKSNYGITRLSRGFFDLITVKFLLSYSSRPLQLFGIPGLLSFFAGFIIGIYLVIEKFIANTSIGDRPLLLLAVLLVIVGIQFIVMGLLGEITARTFYEVHSKPTYHVKEIIE